MTDHIPEISDEDIIESETVTEESTQETPNRTRRGIFVFGTWLLAFGVAATLALNGNDSKVSSLFVDGCVTYMIAIAITYLTSHSIDRADLFGKIMEMVSEKNNKPTTYRRRR